MRRVNKQWSLMKNDVNYMCNLPTPQFPFILFSVQKKNISIQFMKKKLFKSFKEFVSIENWQKTLIDWWIVDNLHNL